MLGGGGTLGDNPLIPIYATVYFYLKCFDLYRSLSWDITYIISMKTLSSVLLTILYARFLLRHNEFEIYNI